eukprot:2755184-Rhodomonas_salina.2
MECRLAGDAGEGICARVHARVWADAYAGAVAVVAGVALVLVLFVGLLACGARTEPCVGAGAGGARRRRDG